MKLSISEPLCASDDTFNQWDVTEEAIVLLLDNNADSFTLQAWNWEGKQLWHLNIAENEPRGLAIGGNFVFLGSESGAIKEFDLSSGTISHVYLLHDSAINIISTRRDPIGSLLIISGSCDGSIQVWDQASKNRRFHLTGLYTQPIFSFEIKSNVLISTGGPTVALWDLSTGERLQTYTCEDVRLYATVLISDEILVTGGSGGLIWIFDCKTSKLITTLSTKSRVLNGLILYRPNILLSTDTSGQVYLWSLDTYKALNQVRVHDHAIMTRTLLSNILVTGGKEGGGLDNVCGLDCSLKSCDLEMLLQGGDVRPIEHGLPCRSLWKVQAIRARMVVCLFKRGRPYLDIWSLD